MTNETLAERLEKCVKPLALNLLPPGDWSGDWYEQGQADYTARILAALDLDAIARLVSEAVEREREGCAQIAEMWKCQECGKWFHPDDEDCCDRPSWYHQREGDDIAAAIRARADRQTEGE